MKEFFRDVATGLVMAVGVGLPFVLYFAFVMKP